MTHPLCPHRWRIAEPAGPVCPAVCRRCGAERDFPSAGDETAWSKEPSPHTDDERAALRASTRRPVRWPGNGKAW